MGNDTISMNCDSIHTSIGSNSSDSNIRSSSVFRSCRVFSRVDCKLFCAFTDFTPFHCKIKLNYTNLQSCVSDMLKRSVRVAQEGHKVSELAELCQLCGNTCLNFANMPAMGYTRPSKAAAAKPLSV